MRPRRPRVARATCLPARIAQRIDSMAKALWVNGERMNVARNVTTAAVPTRIALYKASAGNMDQGWTEWLLDTHELQVHADRTD